ncbi:hypothetical protein ILUMI_15803, partial [Ignelater luminosus]
VWYVPGLYKNLFSVLAAHNKNPDSTFSSTATDCWLLNNDKVVLQGKRSVGRSLYKTEIQPEKLEEMVEIDVADEFSMLKLYHERWGHQDGRHVKAKLQSRLPFGHSKKCRNFQR